MSTEKFHEEIQKWKDKNKLLDLAKFKMQTDSSHIYWSCGIILTLFVLVMQTKQVILSLNFFGPQTEDYGFIFHLFLFWEFLLL